MFKVMEALKVGEIIPRRYFYPSLNTLSFMPRQIACPVSEDIAVRVLSLPLYVGLPYEDIESVFPALSTVTYHHSSYGFSLLANLFPVSLRYQLCC
jgi:dTDP-4-amino-4,6-dideoxygalactose transaminase